MKILLLACAVFATAAAVSNEDSCTAPFCESKFVTVNGTRYEVRSSPAITLFGITNGELERCLAEQPGEGCELFHQFKHTAANSLLISGESIYTANGMTSGKIFKCVLNEKKSCRPIYYSPRSPVNSLAIGHGQLFAGTNKNIISCELPDHNCRPLHNMTDSVFSLIQIDNHLYAGSGDRLMRCSLTEDSCTEILNMNSSVMGLATMGNNLYAVTFDGKLWECRRKASTGNDCTSINIHYNSPRALSAFNGSLYVHNYYSGTCKLVNNTSCERYADKVMTRSVALAYGTHHMQTHYMNEHKSCARKLPSESPCVLVTYYNEKQRAALEVQIKDGRLYNAGGSLVDTRGADEGHAGPAAIFAMGPEGRILLSNSHPQGSVHTSSLFAGQPVAGVGEIVVEDGVIKKITACSDHYKPDVELNKQVIQSLRTQGYTDPLESLAC